MTVGAHTTRAPHATAEPTTQELAVRRTSLAAKRTLMAADRSLMAWVRTALSMISFGFTIYKVLHGLEEPGTVVPALSGLRPQLDVPRTIGLFLTGLGTASMIMGVGEYWQTVRDLHPLEPIRLGRPSLVNAAIMSVLGVVLFLAILRNA